MCQNYNDVCSGFEKFLCEDLRELDRKDSEVVVYRQSKGSEHDTLDNYAAEEELDIDTMFLLNNVRCVP